MSILNGKIPTYLDMIRANREYLKHNFKIFDIYRGRLLRYVMESLKQQLSGQAYEQASKRIPPINVLKRINDKRSKLYAAGVNRSISGGTVTDTEILSWYEKHMRPNHYMGLANRYFNLFKNTLVMPFIRNDGTPAIRVVPSDRFIVYKTHDSDEDMPGGAIFHIGQGASTKHKGKKVEVYEAIEKYGFVYFDSEGVDLTSQYAPDQPEGINALGRLPFVYMNRDPEDLLPVQDTDTLAMTVLIPILLTDINFAHMFQAFSIVYGINVTDKGIHFGPNAFWEFKTEPGSDQKPEIGTITPSADINGGLNLVANQFALWLNTLGIKAGAVGDINGTNFSSGISKILDEMDTSEDRQEQVPYFAEAEADLWDLTLNHLHPNWMKLGLVGVTSAFSRDAMVTANFSEQVPLVTRGKVVADSKAEVDAGFTTNRRAMKKINPQMTESEIDELITEIEAANTVSGVQQMNGAQVDSLVTVAEKVAMGTLPKATAIAICQAAFGMTEEAAKTIIDPIEVGSITPEQV